MFLNGKQSQRWFTQTRATADLLIVTGEPDRRIEDIRNVAYVIKDGRAYDPVKLRASGKGFLGRH